MARKSGNPAVLPPYPTRRELLAGVAVNVLSIGFTTRSVEARDLDLSEFLQLSERLTAHRNLRPDIARQYLRRLADTVGLYQKARAPANGQGPSAFERRIVADWYSGLALTPQGAACLDYTGALMWEAMGFATPRGVPAAEAGRWAIAPS
jgi:hypothetical protein